VLDKAGLRAEKQVEKQIGMESKELVKQPSEARERLP
jgi:hypothetical protein